MFAENLTLMEPQSQSDSVEFWGSTSSVCLLSNVAVVPHSRTMDTHNPRSSGCLVMLNGFPGVGKLTIARSLQSSLTNQNVETRLIGDHLIIDPAEAVHPGRGHQHRAFRDKLRSSVFDELKTLPGQDIILIMTCSLGANVADTAVFVEYLEVSQLFITWHRD
jgi:hypothetical protein